MKRGLIGLAWPRVGGVAVGIAVGVALLHGLLYIFLVPPWQHYDEPNHFEYVWLVAHRPHLPQPGDYDPAMRRAVALSMIEHDFFRGMGSLPDLDAPDGKVWIGQYAQLDDPPLYYLLAALPLRLFPGISVTRQLYLARLVSLALYLLTIGMAFGLVRELTHPSSPLRWLVPLTMALLPSFADLMTAVNNDVGAAAAFSLFLWGCVRLLKPVRPPASQVILHTAWVIGAALLCLLTKPSAYVAVPLCFPALLLGWTGGRWRRLAWAGLAVGGVLAGLALFNAPAASAFWYAEANQGRLALVRDANAPWGEAVWMLEARPGQKSRQAARFRQMLAAADLAALPGQTVTWGGWLWASQPVTATVLQVYIQGDEVLERSQPWALQTQPRFYALSFSVPPGAWRGWVSLAAEANVAQPTQIYADGVVLAAGARRADEPPVFDTPAGQSGVWQGEAFTNLLRGASAEHTWPGIHPQWDALSARLLPDQGRISLIAYTLFDWPAGRAYYDATLSNLLHTFWAVFGWGHVRVMAAVYPVLGWVTLAGVVGALVGYVRRWRVLPGTSLVFLGLSLLLVWGNAVVRGAIYVFQPHGFIPAARYAYPVIIPTVLLLTAGWLLAARLLQHGLRLPGKLLLVFYLSFFLAVDALALFSLVQFYRA